ncbi:MAG: cyoE [Francisellaceae bacterium]|nr:cyoE [Francisellaceae bacterium]
MQKKLFKNYFSSSLRLSLQDYLTLCKPRVVLLMLVTAWVGMFLSRPGVIPLSLFIFSTAGIGLCAASAAVINQLIDRQIDAKMRRTHSRPLPANRINPRRALVFAILLGFSGFLLLISFCNVLTAFLSLATFLGYAFFYTLILKRATPQNIVIGGATGATPPLLGWAAVTNDIDAYALLLVLIIFTWTPPHFWALAIYRREDYQEAGIPMLPITHGVAFTQKCIFLYTILLSVVTLLPFVTRMSGNIYLFGCLILNGLFLRSTIILYKDETQALKTFQFSITYLLLLFIVLLIDHYLYIF